MIFALHFAFLAAVQAIANWLTITGPYFKSFYFWFTTLVIAVPLSIFTAHKTN